MAISVVNSTLVTANNASTITVPKPAGTLKNHVVYVYVTADTFQASNPQPDSAWPTVAAHGSGNRTLLAYRKVMTGSEPASWTFYLGGVSAAVSAVAITFAGVDVNAPEEGASKAISKTTAGTTLTVVPNAAVTSGALFLYGFGTRTTDGLTAVSVTSSTAGVVKYQDAARAGASVSVHGWPNQAAGAVPSANFDLSTSAILAGSELGIRPATAAPAASFTMSASTVSLGASPTVTFTDTSTNGPTSWSWNFGDGTTSTAENPVKTYTAAGTYTVQHTATNAVGVSTTTTQTVTVTSESWYLWNGTNEVQLTISGVWDGAGFVAITSLSKN